MPWSIIGVIAGLAALVGGWFWWWWPKRQVDRLKLTIRDPKARADVEDNLRKTIGQLLGGAAVLFGAWLAYLQFSQQQQASQQQFSQQQRVAQRQFLEQQQASHDLLISNQVSKGFEQLGNEKIVVRLGGIYALEGVMNTSEQYHRPVLEALSAFVRDGTRTEKGTGPPPTDIQAALTVIGRRKVIGNEEGPDLDAAHIPQAILWSANLSRTNLQRANLNGASLMGANLRYTSLAGADLSRANLLNVVLNEDSLLNANLSGAFLHGADLSRAGLWHANLSGAEMRLANLSRAQLNDANLSHADLTGAQLNGADLTGTDLTGAQLNGADLTGTTVSQRELDKACGTKAKLDPGLTLKPCR
jgi:uncharacterized protein YjbI with pentapeptide repeats